MIIHRDLNKLRTIKHAVIATGTFDGLHKGHLKIVNQVKDKALEINGESVIVTFFPHPRLVLQNRRHKDKLRLLTSFDEKLELLEKTGIDHLVVVPFTAEFSQTEPGDYIKEFLVKKLKCKCIITGYDHHFGKNRRGNFRMLEEYGKALDFTVKEIPEYVLKEVIVSSTKIREAMAAGEVHIANEYLGYDFFITGKVVKGNQLGRTLGFPTANIEIADENKLVPKYGIYIAEVSKIAGEDDHKMYPALVSIGIRPTISDNRESIEAYLLDFDGDLYGKQLRVHLKKYIRPEIKFKNLDELVAEMKEDELIARKFFGLPEIKK